MLRNERVKAAIQHKETDIVPYNIEFTGEELLKVTRHFGFDEVSFADYAGNHLEKAECNVGGNFIRPGFFRDEFAVVWNRSGEDKDIGIIEAVLLVAPSMNGFEFARPDSDGVKKNCEKLVNNGNDTFKLAKIGTSYFERAWSLRGMENLLMDFLTQPEFVEELFEKILAHNLQIIDAALDYSIDGFYFGDDYGGQNGLLMSPQTWCRFIKPGLAKMFEKVKSAGKVVVLHSCGDVSRILGELIDIGLDVYQTVQPQVYDLKKLKADYGRDLAFWGGISTQQTLPFVKPAELKDIVKKTIDIMAHNGGYIAGPTHRIAKDVPIENIIALVEVLKGQ